MNILIITRSNFKLNTSTFSKNVSTKYLIFKKGFSFEKQ